MKPAVDPLKNWAKEEKVAKKVSITFANNAVYPDGWIENEPLQGEWKPPLQKVKHPRKPKQTPPEESLNVALERAGNLRIENEAENVGTHS